MSEAKRSELAASPGSAFHWEGNVFHWHDENYSCTCDVFAEGEWRSWSLHGADFMTGMEGRCPHEASASYMAMHPDRKIIFACDHMDNRKHRTEITPNSELSDSASEGARRSREP